MTTDPTRDTVRTRRGRRDPRRGRTGRAPRRGLFAAGLGAPLLLLALFGAAVATDRSDFCDTCHEMAPFHEAWSGGAHAGKAECIDCHVDPGIGARLAHKPAALGEVVAHFRGDTSFPRSEASDIPNARCTRCHEGPRGISEEVPAFDHAAHEESGSCASCHSRTGHSVAEQALRDAGVFDAATAASRAPTLAADAVASPGAGLADVVDHPDVSCSACHALSRSPCTACHTDALTDDHPPGDDCSVCHPSAADWTFSHPGDPACDECHELPTDPEHPDIPMCDRCHLSTDDWAFTHPGDPECADCHTRPDEDDHPERDDCGTCHSVEGSWAHDR